MQKQEQEHIQKLIQEEIAQESPPRQQILVMRNIMDNQLESSDDIEIGRVADIEAELLPDGRLVLTNLMTGPESLAGRISSHLRPMVHFFLRNCFEHSIPIDEIDGFHPTLRLRHRAIYYDTGQSDRWIADHILRWIPGSGWKEWHEKLEKHQTETAESTRQRKDERPVIKPEPPSQLPHTSRTTICIEDLIGSKIVTAEGRKLGRIVDIHVPREREPEVMALVSGHLAWLYRLGVVFPFSQVFHLKFHPCIVPWSAVENFERLTVTLKPGFEVDSRSSMTMSS